MRRLRRQLAASGDPELERLHDELAGYPGVAAGEAPEAPPADGILLPLQLRGGEADLALFTTVTAFGTPLEITLAEPAVEAFHPVDAETARIPAAR
jgi:hypothetical protein